jgi:protein translocase SecG subunit
MKTLLTIIQIMLSVSLTVLIFFQSGSEESNSNLINTSSYEKRGWEKVMFNLTITLLVIFLVSSIIQTII